MRRTKVASALLGVVLLAGGLQGQARAGGSLPTEVPAGTALVVADQNEALQTLMIASGEQQKLAAAVTYANFLGGPAILEAFRARALDLATVGNTPPIQAQAAGETIPIVAALATSEPDYQFAVRPGLTVSRLEELRGKRIAYAEGTGRQPFVLNALKAAGLAKADVTLVPLRAADFPDAIRSGQVDVAALNEPHFSRYLADFADQQASALPRSEHDRLPRSLTYLYASGEALADPAKAAAIRDFVRHWIAAKRWSKANPDAWVKAYYVDRQNLKETDGKAIVQSEGQISFPLLRDLVSRQQGLIDLIFEAGDIPERLDAAREFDLRFDEVIETAAK
ncbi:ABC transporter substrate-binding protein [Inquilinus limosus]|uniref:Nitrate ABC transporter substrate-binding protein n=1 Tax=Inquilinus limosus TaxID=171674 RepID=A0A211ZV18_9PROT|nr:ABC transporter substrate-binding protein [Inquilinus limosus]OWJ69138.1 nitrate ABC transporter substrate-binding protein [Inquilinus limosus]